LNTNKAVNKDVKEVKFCTQSSVSTIATVAPLKLRQYRCFIGYYLAARNQK